MKKLLCSLMTLVLLMSSSVAMAVANSTLEVVVSPNSPVGATLPSGVVADVAVFDFTARGGDVDIYGLTVSTYGLTNLPTDHALYLYEGDDRLSNDEQLDLQNLVTFDDFDREIEDGEILSLTLKLDVGTVGPSHVIGGFEISAAGDMDINTSLVNGAFPIQADSFALSQASTGTVIIQKNGLIQNPDVDEDDVTLAKFKIGANQEDARIEQLSVRFGGSINTDEIENLELYSAGDLNPIATVANIDDTYHLANFVLDNPFTIQRGDWSAFTVKADLNTGRTGDDINVFFHEDVDVVAIGETYGYGMNVDRSSYDGAPCNDASGDCSYSEVVAGDLAVVFQVTGPAYTVYPINTNDAVLMNITVTALQDSTIKSLEIIMAANERRVGQGLLNNGVANFTDIKLSDAVTGSTLMGPIDVDSFTTTSLGSTAITENRDRLGFYNFTDDICMDEGEVLELVLTADVSNSGALVGTHFVGALNLNADTPVIRDVNNKIIDNSVGLYPLWKLRGRLMRVGGIKRSFRK